MTSLLPYNLRDDSFLALEECVKLSLETDMKAIMTSVVDYLPDAVLPYLAEMFSLTKDGYNSCSTSEERISLIKSAVSLHKRKGTIGAVEDLLASYGLTCEIWSDYGGIPHHFKADLDADNKGVDIYETVEDVLTRLNQYKQLRAKLDEVSFSSLLSKTFYANTAIVTGVWITV